VDLVFSFVGFQIQIIPVSLKNGKNNFTLVMQEISSGLNEVVITAVSSSRGQLL